jgi:hypothetical protein
MLLRKIEDMLTARRNRGDLRIEPIDPLIGIHVQLGHKAAPHKADSDFCHGALLQPKTIIRLRLCAAIVSGAWLRRHRASK